MLLDPDAGVEAVLVVLVLLDSVDLLEPPPGFTTVVLFSVFLPSGAGATVSVFCSQAVNRAALARMQIYFFIVSLGCPQWVKA